MKSPKRKQLNAQIYAEASEWLVEFRSGDIDSGGRKEFYDWLRTSPEHMRAYLELAAIWNEGSILDLQQTFDDTALMRDVSSETNVAPLQRGVDTVFADGTAAVQSGSHDVLKGGRALSGGARRSRANGRNRYARAALGAAVVLAALGGAGYWYRELRNTYATGIGEQRTLALDDGSTVQLNSGSRVRVSFSLAQRQVQLLEGQALFDVAKDRTRPFIVRTDTTQIRAVGTQFDVYRKSTATTVTVVEGSVAVIPAATTGPRPADALLTAGEQAIVTAQAAIKQAKIDVPTATAWTHHQLVFQGAALQEVAAEFNRYNKHRLVIHDPQLALLRVTGIFSCADPASLIRFLQARPDVTVTKAGDAILVARKP